ncbi:acyl-CoA thioesterase [Mesorhizobium sp. M0309]|uniref:acyl-CoA thioesterase n=1 Tax=unclassified Mesorhizobium TaxID=325217 RepID=UPI0003CF35D7|nr:MULTISPECIES: acyl-CoA thioesterase [unclassified Mesorhizobium]ESX77930.1 4-hydroxybenzoyl-CoA thioesterase [Mesorhizobium sp. LSHC414A00]ESZ53160.1 4-hydroxybenzoyl-CoA thioesterase [Mesorhizobium sp. L2C054A000]
MTAPGIETYVGVVHPWMCDAMGHLNVRHYVAMFDDASFQLLGRIAAPNLTPTLGWADVRMEIDYAHETAVGTLVTIRSVVEKVGKSSLTYLHEMRGTLDDVLYARVLTVTVRFDLSLRSKIDLEADARHAATSLLRAEGDTRR